MDAEQHVAVFWDESVVFAADCSGFHAARFVCKAAETLGTVRSVKFYGNIECATKGPFPNLRSELKHAGVTVVDAASTGQEASAVKMSLTDALIYALDNPPCPLLFVSADPDVCYSISLLRMRGYRAFLLCPSKSDPIFEEFQLPDNSDTPDFIGTAPSPPSNGRGSPDGPQSLRSGSSFNGVPKTQDHLTVGTQTNGFPTHGPEAPPLLPPGDIDAFRERFTSSRPKLDTAMSNSYRPHHHSFPPFNCNELAGPDGPSFAPFFPIVPIPGVQPKVDVKGKGRATNTDSTLNSPIVLTATSMSVSRSNSLNSVYRGPPTGLSTAPTSAMPWYRPDFKMGADGTFKAATTRSAEDRDGQAEGVDASSVSGGTDGSATPTATTSSATVISAEIVKPRGEVGARTSVLLGSELQVPSLGAPATPLVPEMIQIHHASPPAATPVATPAPVGAPTMRNGSPSVTASATVIVSSLSSSPLDQRERSEGLTTAPAVPDASTSRGLDAAPVNGQSSTSHGQSTPLSPFLTTTLRVSAVQPTASTPSTIPGLPAHFHTLVHVLQEHLDRGQVYVDRAALCLELRRRQHNILVAANIQTVKRPFVAYLNQAFNAGIILSGEGDVALAEKYR